MPERILFIVITINGKSYKNQAANQQFIYQTIAAANKKFFLPVTFHFLPRPNFIMKMQVIAAVKKVYQNRTVFVSKTNWFVFTD